MCPLEVNENVTLNWDNVQRAINAQGLFLEQRVDGLMQEWQTLLDQVAERPDHLYFTGCGDSFYCGLAAEWAALEWAGVDAWAVEALEWSRYRVRHIPSGGSAWMVAVSNSGRVSRTVEALRQARRHGLRGFAVTYREDSDLARSADHVLPYRYDDPGFGPGTLSYTASLSSLLALVLALGRRAGTLTPAASAAVLKQTHALGRAIPELVEQSQAVAAQLLVDFPPPWPYLCMVGGGPNYATAQFGMAKMIESARHSTVAQQLEEWAHEQYFCTQPGTLTVLMVPPGQSHDRGLEQLRAIRDVGGRAIVLAASSDRDARESADYFVPMPDTTSDEEALTPLVYGVPLQVLAMSYARATGSTMLGFDDPHRMQVNFRQIFSSALTEDA